MPGHLAGGDRMMIADVLQHIEFQMPQRFVRRRHVSAPVSTRIDSINQSMCVSTCGPFFFGPALAL